MNRPNLQVVPEAPKDITAADMLAELVPDLIRAEQTAAQLRVVVSVWRHRLAKERGVAFVREEHVRREFGR